MMELIDQEARQTVWCGTATANVVGSNRFRMISDLAQRLVRLIRQTSAQ
jgi:hypothetical protein